MAKSTTRFLNQASAETLRKSLAYNYLKRFKVLFLSTLKFENFDYGEDYYIADRIFNGLNIASFKLKTSVSEDESPCAFQGYVPEGYDLYDNPVKVRVENLRNDKRIPNTSLTNNVDVVLFRPLIQYYEQITLLIDMLVDTDMTIRTNLKLHKMPFAITGDNDQVKRAIDAVLNDRETVVLDETTMLRSAKTDTPYIIDKLVQFKIAITSEILSILGIKGQKIEKMAQMTVDEVNNNEEEINGFKNNLVDTLNKWLDQTNNLFNTNYKVTLNTMYVDDENGEVKEEEEVLENV